MNWRSPWCQKGYPGWHIECSAMAIKYLGETIDIHTGGVDNLFPHHENEIAQSEAATGKRFANVWLHVEYLLVDGGKMSKSLGNFYTLGDLIAKGYDPRSVRYLLMATHYRQQLDFTFNGLDAAKNATERLVNFVQRLADANGSGAGPEIEHLTSDLQERFEEALNDDLNISVALASIFDFVREVNKLVDRNLLSKAEADETYKLMMKLDRILGVIGEVRKEEKLSKDIKDLILEREKARMDKNWKKADEIRKKLKSMGLAVEDTPEGPRVSRKSAETS
jgi:cysteinyl-tRNA synthetase